MPSSAARVFLFLLLEDAQFFIDYTIQGQAVDLNSRSLLGICDYSATTGNKIKVSVVNSLQIFALFRSRIL
jgi:hypothetical protein